MTQVVPHELNRSGRAYGDIVLANPGHIPWMLHTALAAARRNQLAALYSPFAYGADTVARIAGLPLGPLSVYVAGQLSRRAVPSELAEAVGRAGSVMELVAISARRLGVLAPQTADLRDIAFDRAVASRLPPEATSVICAYHSSLATIRAAKRSGIRSVLDWPVAHHRFAERILTDELRREPAYASTMQFHRVGARRARRLETELEAADTITVLSSFQAETFESYGAPAQKLAVVPFGVDADRYRPPEKEPGGRFRVLFVGQLTQRKGLSYAIDAFLDADLPDSELLLVGAEVGAMPPYAQRHNIRHVPEVRPDQVPDLYRSAHIFVLPSLVEGLARVVLEAMASGLPVIATPNTGAEDVLDDERSGFIVPARDVDAIVDRLRTVHASPSLRTSIGSEARAAARRFTWERYADQMLAVASAPH